ncbi:MAG: hypothetical protein AB8C95_04760 [Phycisphaeraceae bacterium]
MTTNAKQNKTPRSPRIQFVGFCLTMTCALICLAACSSQPRVEKQNDLRGVKVQSLEQQIDALQNKLVQREGELQPAREELDDPLPPMDRAEPSRLAGIMLGVYSGPIDLDGDANYDALRVYVRPIDQRSRPITVKGAVRLRLIATDSKSGATTILDQAYDAAAFNAARHSSITGPQYILKADLSADLPATATIHITLTDAVTGKIYKTQKEVSFLRVENAQRNQ